MPIPYYNTSTPTTSTKNTITKVAVDYGIRDFLLHRNIQNPTRYPQLQTTINGSPKGGEPVLDTMVGSGVILQQPSIEADADIRANNAMIMNRFKNDSQNATDLQTIETIPYDTGYFPNSTSTNGTGAYPNNIDKFGILSKTNDKEYRKKATIKNQYLDVAKQLDGADSVDTQPQGFIEQETGYLETYGALASRGSARLSDIIGTIASGQGLGVSSSGIVTNFDVRATLAGRVLGSTGLIKETRLGLIGSQQLGFAFANNSAFNLQKNTLGQLNLNILDLIKGGSLIRPDYSITVSSSGKVFDYIEKILGIEPPVSKLDDAGSIFSTESGSVSNINRANSMLANTGKGQLKSLLTQFNANAQGIGINDSPDDSPFRTGYVAGYRIDDKFVLDGNPKVYAFANAEGIVENFIGSVDSQNPIPIISYNRDIEKYGFKSPNDDYSKSTIKRPTFSWGSVISDGVNQNDNAVNLDVTNKTSLLAKTQKLFNSVGMRTIVSRKGIMGIVPTQIQTAVVGGGISKGNAVKTSKALKGALNTAEETFCRSWTTYDRYDSVDNLVRSAGLNQNGSGSTVMSKDQWRRNTEGSVLDDNGFVRITPYKGEDQTRGGVNAKKYMFSIENLAWAGAPAQHLLPVEQGPGDLVSGKFGRIMWFPPYDINFTENGTASWESTNFIGRGEPIYTYNNSERTGTLSFKIIVDHPSQMNGFAGSNGPADDYIDSYFAGCQDIEAKWLDKLTLDEITTIETKETKSVTKVSVEKEIAPPPFSIYFLNDVTAVNTEYENGDGNGIGTYSTEPQTHNGKTYKSRTLIDGTDFGLNATPIQLDGQTYNGWIDPAFQAALKTHLTEKCPHCRVDIYGFASSQGWADANAALAKNRADNFYKWIQNNVLPRDKFFDKRKNVLKGKGVISGTGNAVTATDSKLPKSARKIDIKFVPDPNLAAQDSIRETVTVKTDRAKVNKKIINRYYNETAFFEKMAKDNPFVFDSIREKIRYFHPAFHSTTPEGFNARLTFLNQCLRQGPTLDTKEPKNLAFGAPPVCILRIGDFYNTKIIIDNIGYDFEPLVWDLNPEGIGVQPMIANVNISFKFIGGSSLKSPINKLQNALSFNYYANSQVYDARADYVAVDKDTPTKTVNGVDIPNYVITTDLDISSTKMVPEEKVLSEQPISSVTSSEPEMDQIASNEASTSGLDNQETPNPNADELSEVVLVRVTTDEGVIRPELNIKPLSGLTKDYLFKAMLFDSIGNPICQVGSGTLLAGVLYQKFPFSGFNDKLVGGNKYSLQLKFDNSNKSLAFTV